jgi:hypothetical protein
MKLLALDSMLSAVPMRVKMRSNGLERGDDGGKQDNSLLYQYPRSGDD